MSNNRKKLLQTLFIMIPFLMKGQMVFEKGDWASVLAKAQKENKMVFVDFYTTWCGPCKQMARDIFPMKKVGNFYNTHFVNYKIDAEKGEGKTLAKKYSVNAYPTYIFTDAKGNFLHQAIGSMPAEKFIAKGEEALDPAKQLGKLLKNGKQISKAEMPAYLRTLKEKRLPYKAYYESYIKSLSKKELLTKDTYELMQKLGGRDAKGFTYNLILKEKDQFTKVIGEKEIKDYFYKKMLNKAYSYVRQKKSHQPVIDEVKAMGYDFGQEIDATIYFTSYMHKNPKDYQGLINASKTYLANYGIENPSLIYYPVFVINNDYFLLNDKVKAYHSQLVKVMEERNHDKLMDVYGNIGLKYVRASQFAKALEYYRKGYKIAKVKGKKMDVFEQSIAYIEKAIETLKKGEYTINGKGFDTYNGFTFRISYTSPNRIGEHEETEGVTIKDGKFTVTGKVNTPMPARWSIYDGDDFKGAGKIIIEPGTFPLTLLNKQRDFLLDKGTYNYYVYNAWKNSKKYKDALKELRTFESRPNLNYKDSIVRKEFSRLYHKMNTIKSDYLKHTFENTADPLVKVLVVYEGLLFYDIGEDKSGSKRLAELEQLLPNHYLVKTMKHHVKRHKENVANRAMVMVGKTIKDFTAKDHNGKEFNLSKILKNKKYILVEFWASWCGPCRAEIPHMKKAYTHYKNKGFEIVSFSLDRKKNMWDKAYKEDEIPWIDTSDLLARKSPVVKMYGVTGIPANYLVEASTGKIIAKDLRQEKLDKKLKELLGEKE